jgi:hypothetical protein
MRGRDELALMGLTLPPDAEQKLVRMLSHEWELYDGVAVPRDDTLRLDEILLSIMMNSRLDTAEKVRSIWNGRQAAENALAKVPREASLCDQCVDWDSLADLLQAFCAIKWAGWAVATKILHKKRPALVPIYDSVMIQYYKDREKPPIRWGTPNGQKLVRELQVFRQDLLECQDRIAELCATAAANGWPVTPVRALEAIIWIENEPMGYYRS